MTKRNHHVVLLGDSIFDNQRYVRSDEPDVVTQLQSLLPEGSTASLFAVDGAVTYDVAKQLRKLPSDATHLVVSVGGNDALQYTNIGDTNMVQRLAEIKSMFRKQYHFMLDAVLDRDLPTAICTIYGGNFAETYMRQLAEIGTSVFNDVITYEASARKLSLIDLRVIFTKDEDYANPIEPSAIGGEKLARAINQWREGLL